MESLESLRGQLESFDKLHTLVKTMMAMSAASIHQYEKAVISLADYTRTVELGLHVVLQDMQETGYCCPAQTRTTAPGGHCIRF